MLRLAALLALLVAIPASTARGERGADGRFDARRSSHFDLYQDVDIDETGGFHGSRRFEEELLDALEGAYARIGDLLGLRPARRIQVQVYDARVFDASFAPIFRFPAAGFYAGVIRVRAGTSLDHALLRCLRHELVHAALDQQAPSLRLPGWLNEGLAEWFEARLDGARGLELWQAQALGEVARRGALFSLAELSVPAFGGFGPQAAALAYTQSHAFVAWLVGSRNERELARFVRELLDSGDLSRSLRRVYRSDLADLEGRFAAELSR